MAITLALILAAAGAVAVGTSQGSVSLPPTACSPGTVLKSGDIATIAGNGKGASSSKEEGAQALAAAIDSSSGSIAVDGTGAVYLGDTNLRSLRRIGADGIISTIADGLYLPLGVAIDAAGNVYVANDARSLERVDPSGTVSTVAGTGVFGSTGNDGPASLAEVNPSQVAIGPRGELYIDDLNSYRTIDPDGVIHAFAGSRTPGYAGDDGPAVDARFGVDVVGVAADAAGNVYLDDPGNHRIRKVDPTGTITTIAGTGQPGSDGDDGPATAAAIDEPDSIAVDEAGNVYFSDFLSNKVRRIDPSGIITTVAGTGVAGFSGDCGPAVAAQLNRPAGLAVHDGLLYVLDEGNHRVRVILP
jgi:streptogramin lyase